MVNNSSEVSLAIKRLLSNDPTLQELDLSKNKIGDRGAKCLGKALTINSTLQVLFLYDNKIGYRGAAYLADALAIRINSTLKLLDLRNNKIGDGGAKCLANTLAKNSALQKLSLSKNNIGHDGAECLANALATNSTLRDLCLFENNIGDRGAECLANALATNSTLQRLYLRDSNVGDRGAECLANALVTNSTLQTLDMGSSKIGDDGAVDLANVLVTNSTLQALGLFDNKIGDRGADCLANALATNSTLMMLDLIGNIIGSSKVLDRITSCLERNNNTIQLERDNNAIRPPDEDTTKDESFFGKLAQVDSWNDATNRGPDLLEALIPVIADLHQTRLYYTLVANCIRAGLISNTDANSYIDEALEASCELCKEEYSIVMMKLILDKALEDKYITREDMHRLDNRAELKRVEHAPFMVSMREAIQKNATNIQNLDKSINQIKSGLRRKQKVETVVGLVSAVINIVSFGIGGGVVLAVEKVFGSIVDFGDIDHIRNVAQASKESQEEMLEMVDKGIEIASGRYADTKLEEAIKNKSALVAMCVTVVMYQPQNHGKQKVDVVEDVAKGSVFPDAILNEEEEAGLPYHIAVKYGDMEELKKLFEQDNNDDVDINQVDSKGRTAMDLAALTGQVSFLQLFNDHKGRFKFNSTPRMKIIAKNRESKSLQYLEIVHNSTK